MSLCYNIGQLLQRFIGIQAYRPTHNASHDAESIYVCEDPYPMYDCTGQLTCGTVAEGLILRSTNPYIVGITFCICLPCKGDDSDIRHSSIEGQ